MNYSDYLDIEIKASRKGILPSKEIERLKASRERQRRFHEAHPGYRTEQTRKRIAEHPEYFREYEQREYRKEYRREYYRGKA